MRPSRRLWPRLPVDRLLPWFELRGAGLLLATLAERLSGDRLTGRWTGFGRDEDLALWLPENASEFPLTLRGGLAATRSGRLGRIAAVSAGQPR